VLSERTTFIDRLDPRVRLVCGLAASLAPLFLVTWRGLGIALLLACLVAFAARVPAHTWTTRLIAMNAFVLMLLLVLPWSVPGESLVIVGGADFTREGLAYAGRIALRANIVLIALTTFFATMEPITAGHALQRLRVPKRLVLLLMFTVRYIGVFEQEYLRLRQAMRVRGFAPRLDVHTLRSYGYLTGMLLVHAFDRSERVLEAMRCRGFTGRFHTHRHMQTHRADWTFAACLAVALVGMLTTEFAL
jgi:cobalt/nickel transport system permease protein